MWPGVLRPLAKLSDHFLVDYVLWKIFKMSGTDRKTIDREIPKDRIPKTIKKKTGQTLLNMISSVLLRILEPGPGSPSPATQPTCRLWLHVKLNKNRREQRWNMRYYRYNQVDVVVRTGRRYVLGVAWGIGARGCRQTTENGGCRTHRVKVFD